MFRSYTALIISLVILAIIAIFCNLSTGFLSIGFQDFFNSESPHYDIAHLRLNRVLAVLLAGISVPTSGFILQEYFRNPLAGSEVLGISSMASLSVAFYIFLSEDVVLPEFLQHSFISISAIIGSVFMLFILLGFSRRIRDKSFLIIFGFLVSALAGAVVSIMQFYADSKSLRNYILWSFGANNHLTAGQIGVLSIFILIGLVFGFRVIKPLIGMSLGEEYARSIGVNINRVKLLVITATSLLSASITAFLGPILFVGIVVPHFSRMLYNPAKLWHQFLLNILLGMVIMEVFSTLSEIISLSMNIISSLFGIPVILMMMIRKKKMND